MRTRRSIVPRLTLEIQFGFYLRIMLVFGFGFASHGFVNTSEWRRQFPILYGMEVSTYTNVRAGGFTLTSSCFIQFIFRLTYPGHLEMCVCSLLMDPVHFCPMI